MELYDRRADPHERVDIAEQRPDVVSHMEGLLWTFIDRENPISTEEILETRPVDPEILERLRSLGYTQ